MTATVQARPEAPRPAAEPTPRKPRSTGAQRTLLAAAACALGAMPLKDLFRDYAWLFVVWASMLVVIAPAVLFRLRREPEPWHVWPGLVLLVPWLTIIFVPKHAWGHVVPTTATWHDVSRLLTDLHQTTAREVAPIRSTKAVRLVLCAMLALLAALVDLVAVVGRRGALAGVPLLVVFTVAGAVPKRTVSWPLFVIGAVGFLLLLALDAEDDRRDWGKRIPRPGRSRPPSRLGVSAQRVGVIAIIVALALPLALPTHSGNLLSRLFRNDNGNGPGIGAGGGKIDPFVALKGQLVRNKAEALFTVELTSRPAKAVPFYARVNVLSDFTGNGWQRGASGSEQPLEQTRFETIPPTTVEHGIAFAADISISGLGGNPPVFDRPTSVNNVGANTRWSQSDLLLVGDDVSSGDRITETWEQPAPTPAELNAAPFSVTPELQSMLALPSNMPAYVVNLVSQLTAGLSTPYGKARAISNYFTATANGFKYSLATKTGDSGSELVDFLHNRQGFCQQYAAAMGVMLRLAGVPSRVVLGYTHPLPDKNNSFLVTTNDAHSWVEAYFEGIGWVPFDPTPLVGIDGGSAADLPWAPHPQQVSTQPDPGVTKTNTTGGGPLSNSGAPSASGGAANAEGSSSGSNAGAFWTLGVLALLVGIALVPAGIRQVRRRSRIALATHRGDPDPLWTELADTAIDLGYVWSPARSPRQVAAWLRPSAPTAAGSLDTLAGAVELARYAPSDTPRDVAGLSGHLATVSRELRSHRSGRTRFLSRFWPASLGLAKHMPHRKR